MVDEVDIVFQAVYPGIGKGVFIGFGGRRMGEVGIMEGDVVGFHAHECAPQGEVGDEIKGANARVHERIAEAEYKVNMVRDRFRIRRGFGCGRTCPAKETIELVLG
jgi:hypothetical protein